MLVAVCRILLTSWHLMHHIGCLHSVNLLLSPLEESYLSLHIDSPHYSFTFTQVVCLAAYVSVCVCEAWNPSEICFCYCLCLVVIVNINNSSKVCASFFRLVSIRLQLKVENMRRGVPGSCLSTHKDSVNGHCDKYNSWYLGGWMLIIRNV